MTTHMILWMTGTLIGACTENRWLRTLGRRSERIGSRQRLAGNATEGLIRAAEE